MRDMGCVDPFMRWTRRAKHNITRLRQQALDERKKAKELEHRNSAGFLLYHKRLERGSFEMPRRNADTGYYELSWETFSFIMSGVSLESVCFRKHYRTRFKMM